jgi:uncharacterized protein (UPF0335 family)
MNRNKLKCLLTLVAGLFLIGLTVNAQTAKMYVTDWKKIDSLVNKGLPKSALAEVRKVYEKARKEGQDAQVIKALVYQMGLQQQTREE